MRHRFHALCPYFAMFPETFPAQWIEELTKPGDTVLDPFSGRGTTPFEALMRGRNCIATDVNTVAFCLTKAKCEATSLRTVLARLSRLRGEYEPGPWQDRLEHEPEFFRWAYHDTTLAQLLYLRQALDWRRRRTDCVLAALVLGSLHGESQRSERYLSNQMPRTISTKPAYSVRFWQARALAPPDRDAFALLRTMALYRYASDPPHGKAFVWLGDMRSLPFREDRFPSAPALVVTSPPYLDVTHYEEDQWLRRWFLGGPTSPSRGSQSRDDRHTVPDRYWSFIADMWRSLGAVVRPFGHVVIRIGARQLAPERVLALLEATCRFAHRRAELAYHQVSELRRRQTDAFRPGSRGCLVEVDAHFRFLD